MNQAFCCGYKHKQSLKQMKFTDNIYFKIVKIYYDDYQFLFESFLHLVSWTAMLADSRVNIFLSTRVCFSSDSEYGHRSIGCSSQRTLVGGFGRWRAEASSQPVCGGSIWRGYPGTLCFP